MQSVWLGLGSGSFRLRPGFHLLMSWNICDTFFSSVCMLGQTLSHLISASGTSSCFRIGPSAIVAVQGTVSDS